MSVQKNNISYMLPISMFLTGIIAFTALSVVYSEALYNMLICYIPIIHMELKNMQYGIGFCKYVLQMRIPLCIIMAVTIFSGFSLICFGMLAFFSGALAALVIASSTMLMGMTGIINGIFILLPHSLFYIFSYWAFYELAGKKDLFSRTEQMQIVWKICLIWLAGMICEMFLSPITLERMIKL